MSFLVIEGLDGSGKSTQIGMLKKHLEVNGIPYKYLHFPRLEEGIYGKLIARFLRGEMGDNNQVDPYLVALIFAGDRWEAKAMIEQWLAEGYLVLVDRYVYSNIAFQCAKLPDKEEQLKLQKWILDLEFDNYKLPSPDQNIFLDVPFDFTRERLTGGRTGNDRDYLNGQTDIHEQDLDFQGKVRMIYHSLCTEVDNISIVDCSNEKGQMHSTDTIFNHLLDIIKLPK
jgi:dTMP kinase